jgi:hypothetical protein
MNDIDAAILEAAKQSGLKDWLADLLPFDRQTIVDLLLPAFQNIVDPDYNAADDMRQSIEDCYRAIRERKATGGKGWPE